MWSLLNQYEMVWFYDPSNLKDFSILLLETSETTSPSQSAAFREPRATVWIQPFSSQCPGAGARLDMLRVRRVRIMQLFQSPGHGVGWQSPGC